MDAAPVAVEPDGPARRSSIEKTPILIDPDVVEPFHRLPDEIVEQILLAADPNGFSSLVLLNSKWRAASQRPHLYRHHLTQCASFLASHGDLPAADDQNLPQLRRLFAREVKRNLFDAYLRPNETVIKLVSNSISSSSCPGGEGMQFAASPSGLHFLAYNSSRIYVIDVRGKGLQVKRELRILRRPVSACITDDASLLVVLSTEMQVDLFDLTTKPPRRKHSIILDNSPRTIAISSCGTVLAAAYDGGIEVSSLHKDALATDRRAVKCDAVDALAFSLDGSQILGTTIHSPSPSTVVLTAPYYDPGSQLAENNLSAMWTTSILFPNTSRDCSHAILLQDGNHGEAEWTFTYDRSFETFRAVRLDDLRNGTTYFTGPVSKAASQSKLLPSTLPASTHYGDVVSAGFQGNEVWVYGVPGDLDALPEVASSESSAGSTGLGRHNSVQSSLSRHPSSRGQEGDDERVPQWQVLCDKLRNNFVAGCKITDVPGISNVKWVANYASRSSQERLVVAARGVSGPRLVTEEEDIDFVDGGRICLIDFDYGLENGRKTEVIIEVGTDDAEVLEEEKRDIETEVAIVRRRTVAQRRGGRTALLRAATSAGQEPPLPRHPSPDHEDDDDDPLVPRTIGKNPTSRRPAAGLAEEGEVASIEEQEALDAPYAHASPRSGTTLRRAATAAAVNRRLNPRTADGRPIEYRRADGRGEHPHESDADNWVPPPPPYQKDDPVDLPAFLRGPHVAPLPSSGAAVEPPTQDLDASANTPGFQNTGGEANNGPRRHSHHRTTSELFSSRLRVEDIPRPRSSPSVRSVQMNPVDIYDVSPPGSPQLRQSNQPEDQQVSRPGTGAAQGPMGASFPASRTETFHVQRSGAPSTNPSINATTTSTRTEDSPRQSAPVLQLHIPNSPLSSLGSVSAVEPQMRRLPNPQTWPHPPRSEDHSTGLGATAYPLTAPPNITGHDLATSLPPAPSSGQLASLNKRISQGNPRRLSGGAQVHQMMADNGGSKSQAGQHHHQQQAQDGWDIGDSTIQMPDFDRPLIISTPTGVSGAFDPPNRRASTRQGEPEILAPVPRHPRQNNFVNPRPVQRLQPIYDTGIQSQPPPQAAQPKAPSALPAWLRSGPSSSRSSPTTVNRRPSRAERSAAKNMKDARKKGWTGDNKKKKKSKRGKDPGTAYEVASSTGWTDVSLPSGPKEKKCIVM
ncbi:F-box domain-containingprotein [Purpureocillium lavendulum]|uniref:F-box domain-containingprotein n=1 Tax=Purpureocillium lavendulum TaxID=1247861 RepID=A0AB34G4Z0_9HYPO|nr:F-box domain-containingprotein [Purpureocillium lavendulum]